MNRSKHMVIPIFVPHSGCPFDCIYCNQKTISGQTEEMTEDKMRDTINEHLKYVGTDENIYIEIGFYGGSFTGIEREKQIAFLKVANEYIEQKRVREIRLSTRPDYINEEILAYLKEFNVKTIELGVQSLDEEVLRLSCRGHSYYDVIKASELIKESEINLGIQTMVGLPGDNSKKDIFTANKVIELRPKLVRIYPALVIKGTYLEKMYQNGAYTPLTLDEATATCAELLELYEAHGIKVIRIGLQPTENINNDMDVAAGPFHPAFRQLVESRVNLNKMEKILNCMEIDGINSIVIYTGNRNLSNVIGQGRSNITYIASKYGLSRVDVKADNDLGNEIIIK